ncbi:MAG: hypothetical protein E6J78_18650 [Deltaproteobacteria bacterium]|nr:MAG: hypothetical protein E6J78_18650 [Deltaproteobacteria bacterium]
MKGIYILAVTAAVIGCGGSSKPPLFTKPAGTIVLGFSVDDSNNKVFADKDMEWKGSMIYDATTNKVTFAGDWNGGNGPYAPLYDDGPLSQGGHEPEGSKAGDHIFGVAVFAAPPTAAQSWGYGLNDASVKVNGRLVGPNGWIWPPGPNGGFSLTAGQATDVKADGLTLKKFGTTDIQFVVDKNALATGSWDTSKITIKGGGWGWNEIQLLDDGTRGDATASDGKFTFVLSQYAGTGKELPHAGLANSADKIEFNVVFNGKEYKDGSGNGLSTGVTAGTKASGASAFSNVSITTGTGNTYITVP